jgi:HD-like signal output (HDOD) protein
MLGWIVNLFRGAPKTAPGSGRMASATQAARAQVATGPSYLELLRMQAEPSMPLTPEEDAQVESMVSRVVAYVVEHELEPPTVPALAPRVLDALKDPRLDVAQLARTLENDQAISAKILTIANSAMFSPTKSVASLRDAITLLGIDQVAQIAIGLATRSLFNSGDRAELAVDRGRWNGLFVHSMVTAFATADIVARQQRRASDQAFLSGLFHDVGKVVALRAISAMTVAGQWPSTSAEVLDEVLHRVHATHGKAIYERWALPPALLQVCEMHHRLEACVDAPALLYWVSLVSSFDDLRTGSACQKREALAALPICAARLGLTDAQLRAANTATKEFAERVQRLFALT